MHLSKLRSSVELRRNTDCHGPHMENRCKANAVQAIKGLFRLIYVYLDSIIPRHCRSVSTTKSEYSDGTTQEEALLVSIGDATCPRPETSPFKIYQREHQETLTECTLHTSFLREDEVAGGSAAHAKDIDYRFSSSDDLATLVVVDQRRHLASAHNVFKLLTNETATSEVLGDGSTGIVYLMNYLDSLVAVKTPKIMNDKNELEHIEREACMLRLVNHHPKILRYLGPCVDGDQSGECFCGIVTEYCEYGTLYNAIKAARKNRTLAVFCRNNKLVGSDFVGFHLWNDWRKRLKLALDIVSALSSMHKKNVRHGDLSSSNIFLQGIGGDYLFVAKIGDLEYAEIICEDEELQGSKAGINSPPWCAPEIHNKQNHTTKADVYSMGVILWELIFLECPWQHLRSRYPVHDWIIANHLKNGVRLEFPESKQSKAFKGLHVLKDLVKASWAENPEDRIPIDQFQAKLKHIWKELTD